MTQPVPGPGPSGATASAGVAEALRCLEHLEHRPVTEHVEVFDGVHRALQDALAALDEA